MAGILLAYIGIFEAYADLGDSIKNLWSALISYVKR